MKKWLIAFTVNAYIIPAFFILLFVFLWKEPFMYIFGGLFLLSVLTAVIFFVINVVYAIRDSVRELPGEEYKNPFASVLAFKLALIPFFVINWFLWIMFVGGTANPFLMWLWILIPAGIAFTYMILLGTSVYSVMYISVMRKNGKLTTGQSVFHIICQLIFVVDVLSSLNLYLKIKKGNKISESN